MTDPEKLYQAQNTSTAQNLNDTAAQTTTQKLNLPPPEPNKATPFASWGQHIAENNGSKLYAVGKKYVIQRLNSVGCQYYYLTAEKNQEQAIASFKLFSKDFNPASTQWLGWKTPPVDAPMSATSAYSWAGAANSNSTQPQKDGTASIHTTLPSITNGAANSNQKSARPAYNPTRKAPSRKCTFAGSEAKTANKLYHN